MVAVATVVVAWPRPQIVLVQLEKSVLNRVLREYIKLQTPGVFPGTCLSPLQVFVLSCWVYIGHLWLPATTLH